MLCLCGCGQETKIAPETDASKGWVRGKPLKFIRYHNRRAYAKYTFPTDSAEYKCWWAMVARCTDPTHSSYEDYGARGITVSEEFNNFDCFIDHVGSRPSPEHSLDRIDNNGNYESGNVRWATRSQQMKNTRRKLSLRLAQEIRALKGTERAVVVAKRFGVVPRTVYHIWIGDVWDESDRTTAAITY